VTSFRVLSALLSGLLHVYLWSRVARPMAPGRRRTLVGVGIALMWLLVPVTTASRLVAPAFAQVAGWVTLTWIAFAGLMVFYLLVIDLGRLVRWSVARARAAPREPAPSATRRQFLAGTAATVAGASVVVGMARARGEHEVVDVEVRLAKLPPALDGFSIVQLSDLHVGMTIGRDFVERVVARANALDGDLIALTGDLVDGPVADLIDDVAPLGQLRARHGVFAITGNHEYYAGVDAWIAAISKLGIRYLRNERVAIERDRAGFDLAGVDDYGADRYEGHGEDIPRALAGRDPTRPVVLLAHQPRQVHHAVEHGVDLQLSGHTHGGQIWPWHYAVKLQQGGLLAGRYDIDETVLYVSRGCGYWGPPVRLLAPLEITRVILRAA
jgi:predicted MPP superfamily phosphohydrolase